MESRIDEDLVALDVDQGTCYGFNATAARIWDMIEQPARLSHLLERLLAEFEVDRETCERELRALIGELERDGLVVTEPIDA